MATKISLYMAILETTLICDIFTLSRDLANCNIQNIRKDAFEYLYAQEL